MTAIAGCISLTDKPVDRATIERMKNVLSIYGQDEAKAISIRGAGFVRTLLRVTPEDRFDSQPVLHQPTATVLLFDGRLDNRTELASSLQIDRKQLNFMADSEIAHRSFLAFGDRFFERFLGDFCVALWIPADRRLLLARDPVGLRPLFWAHQKGMFAFSTMPKGLFAVPGVSKELSEVGLHDYICMLPVQGEDYLFRDIRRLEPGTVLTLSENRITRRRYHSFEDIREISLGSDEEYVDAFSEVFERAVSASLRSSGKLSSHLSGGFDSGVVTGIAAQLLAGQGRRLNAYTAVPRRDVRRIIKTGTRFDELGPAAELAIRFPNVHHELIEPLDESMTTVVREEVELLDCPPMAPVNSSWVRAINCRAASDGVKVILTGLLGNATVSYDGMCIFAQLFGSGKLREWWEESVASISVRDNWKARTVLKHSVFPFLPRWAWLLYERSQGRDQRVQSYSPLRSETMKRLKLRERARHMGWDLTYQPMADSRLARLQMLTRQEKGIYFAAANAYGLEWRDPTADRRVVEFCLSLPEAQFWRRGVDRWLLRRYMHRFIPEKVVQSRVKAVQAADYGVRLKEQISEISGGISDLSGLSRASELVDMQGLQRSLGRLESAQLGSWGGSREYRTKLLRGLTAAEFIRYTAGEND